MTRHGADQFAKEWIEAWNAHDLDRILSHYTDDFEMSSPLIIQLMNEPSGRLIGKERIRAYWQTALSRNPDLRFELMAVYVGAGSITIQYTNQKGRGSAEVFFFDAHGLVFRSAAHYAD